MTKPMYYASISSNGGARFFRRTGFTNRRKAVAWATSVCRANHRQQIGNISVWSVYSCAKPVAELIGCGALRDEGVWLRVM